MSARRSLRAPFAAALASVALALAPLASPRPSGLQAQIIPPSLDRESGASRGGEIFVGLGRSASLAPLLRSGGTDFHLSGGWALFGRVASNLGERVSVGMYGGYLRTDFTATVGGSEAPGSSMPVALFGLDAMVHVLSRRVRITPLIVAGFGARVYLPQDEGAEWSPAWNAGGGLDVRVSRSLTVRIEGRDHMSPYRPAGRASTLEHDLVVTAGLRIDP